MRRQKKIIIVLKTILGPKEVISHQEWEGSSYLCEKILKLRNLVNTIFFKLNVINCKLKKDNDVDK